MIKFLFRIFIHLVTLFFGIVIAQRLQLKILLFLDRVVGNRESRAHLTPFLATSLMNLYYFARNRNNFYYFAQNKLIMKIGFRKYDREIKPAYLHLGAKNFALPCLENKRKTNILVKNKTIENFKNGQNKVW